VPVNGKDALTADIEAGLAAGEPDAIDAALDFLRADPYYFRSGYAKQRMLRRLAGQPLTKEQRRSARTVVLQYVEGGTHGTMRELQRVARHVADNPLRRALRTRLHSDDEHVAWRALVVLTAIKHPGFTDDDLDEVHRVIERAAAMFETVYPVTESLARRFWTDAWHAELVTATRVTRDRAARRLLDMYRRQQWAGTWRR
jgi:hypothetical protein